MPELSLDAGWGGAKRPTYRKKAYNYLTLGISQNDEAK